MKRMTGFILAMVMISVLFTGVASATQASQPLVSVETAMLAELKNDNLALNAANTNPQKEALMAATKLKSDSSVLWSDDYGGMYIGEDNKLHVIVVNANRDMEASLSSKLAYGLTNATAEKLTSEVVYEPGKYSHEALMELFDIIEAHMFSGAFADVRVVSLNDQLNRLDVQIEGLSQEKVDQVYEIIGKTDAVQFQEYEEIFLDVEMEAGDALIFSDGTNYYGGSCAFWGKTSSGAKGLVSAAHCYYPYATSVYYRNSSGRDTSIGSVTAHGVADNVDACFITTNSNASATRDFDDDGVTKTIYGYTTSSDFTSGTTVRRVGKNTCSSGRITTTSRSVSIPLINGQYLNISDVAGASYSVVSGDSGGLVYLPDPTGNYPNGAFVMGVHNSHSSSESYFSKYHNVTNALNISLW